MVEAKSRKKIEEGDNVGKVCRCQITDGFEGNGDEFRFYLSVIRSHSGYHKRKVQGKKPLKTREQKWKGISQRL